MDVDIFVGPEWISEGYTYRLTRYIYQYLIYIYIYIYTLMGKIMIISWHWGYCTSLSASITMPHGFPRRRQTAIRAHLLQSAASLRPPDLAGSCSIWKYCFATWILDSVFFFSCYRSLIHRKTYEKLKASGVRSGWFISQSHWHIIDMYLLSKSFVMAHIGFVWTYINNIASL